MFGCDLALNQFEVSTQGEPQISTDTTRCAQFRSFGLDKTDEFDIVRDGVVPVSTDARDRQADGAGVADCRSPLSGPDCD